MYQSQKFFAVSAVAVTLALGAVPAEASPMTIKIPSNGVHNEVGKTGGTLSVSNSVGQEYFWTKKWQDEEDLAQRDLDQGDVFEFSDAEAAIAWLMSDD